MVKHTQQTVRGRGKPPIYNWDKLLKPGKKYTLYKGKDFNCQVTSMVLLIRRMANKRGQIVHISTDDLSVIVRVPKLIAKGYKRA
jgi:hypothetical protein